MYACMPVSYVGIINSTNCNINNVIVAIINSYCHSLHVNNNSDVS